jgi:hypothetical protein
MIADDAKAIRKAMDALDWQKRVGETEARIKANKPPPTDLPTPKPLFDGAGPPFRGFFLDGLQSPITGYEEIT